jgi:predicted amidohydrolase YtcJ
MILYSAIAKGPQLPPDYQLNASRHFMRELNRFGITSVIDAGGGFQNYPEDYRIVEQLHKRGQLTGLACDTRGSLSSATETRACNRDVVCTASVVQ